MEIDARTNVGELLDRYPPLADWLPTVDQRFHRLSNPVVRRTVARRVTLADAAAMTGMDPSALVARVVDEIARMEGRPAPGRKKASRKTVDAAGTVPLFDPEAQPGPEETEEPSDLGEPEDLGARRRHDEMKAIIRDLHAGATVEDVKARFAGLASEVDGAQIAAMEQELISEGLPVEEVQRLCDVHVTVFEDALAEPPEPGEVPPGHPIHTMRLENEEIERLVLEAGCEAEALATDPSAWSRLARLLDRLADVSTHYTRKENQLFPLLEQHGVTGPTQVMWAVHDEIRAELKQARALLDGRDAQAATEAVRSVLGKVEDMVFKEERILFPLALETLSATDWAAVAHGEGEIGFAWIEGPQAAFPGVAAGAEAGTPPAPAIGVGEGSPAPEPGGLPLYLTTGALSLGQLDLMLRTLPVDVTFVDAQDRVRYYSEGKRVFPRSPAVIGRAVQNCHPPASVHIVQRILDAFRAGERDIAEFWIELEGRFVHIEYHALREPDGAYAGCLEVTQDATHVRDLTGQHRLLDW